MYNRVLGMIAEAEAALDTAYGLACFMHEGCRGGLRRDEIAAMVLMAA
jgi:hypothetical protein